MYRYIGKVSCMGIACTVKMCTSTAYTFPVNAGMYTYAVNIKLEEHTWFTVINICSYLSFIFFCFMFVRACLIFTGKVKHHDYKV